MSPRRLPTPSRKSPGPIIAHGKRVVATTESSLECPYDYLRLTPSSAASATARCGGLHAQTQVEAAL